MRMQRSIEFFKLNLRLTIIAILNGETIEDLKEVKLREEQLNKSVGAFSIEEPHQMLFYTSIVDGRLAIQVAGQNITAVVGKAHSEFVQEEADAVLQFLGDEHGIYSTINIFQGTTKMIATRFVSAWGMIGDATARGWGDGSPDIKLLEDPKSKGLWTLKNVTLRSGELKFRMDNDWNNNFGDNKADGILDLHGDNIKVLAGAYDVVLDLRNPLAPKYIFDRKD
jgi:hypothetical protein